MIACTDPQSGVVVKKWCPASSADLLTVDDMEDADGSLCRGLGTWSITASDLVSRSVPPPAGAAVPSLIPRAQLPDERLVSARAMHVNATGAGATGQWIELSAAFLGLMDASAYGGLEFWVWSANAQTIRIRLNVPIAATVDAAAAGTCNPCPDHFGTEIRMAFATWSKQTVRLADLTQVGVDATPRAFNEVRSVNFRVESIAGFSAPDPLDFWIDDLRFVP